MTDLEKAARMALEAISGSGDFLFNWHDCEPNNEREMQAYQAALAANEKAFNALRQALSDSVGQPAQYDYRIKYDRPCYKCRSHFCPGNCKEPEHLQQPARKSWVGLTDEERKRAIQFNNAHEALAVVIEAKLKEKNT